ncbi:MAG TPA: amidohydrolase family protein [Candidatus Thermoplasmatota archaeon]|nr:amidohydrolase family protein [Candidatus Thermoplasmatota archaeon]
MPLFAGKLLLADSAVEGYLETEGGLVVDWGEGPARRKPDARGWIVPAPVNAHTHVADSFLRDRPGKPTTVAELVGPGGWKQHNLAGAPTDEVCAGIGRYVGEMAAVGVARFLDFREGGLAGVRLLRAMAPDLPAQPVILGRPMTNTFDEAEAKALLAEADGIGLSALRDFADPADVEAWAEACHRARKPFALHVSEAKREDMEAVLALEPTFLVHAVQATKADLGSVADADVPVVVCPRSNAYYGHKTPVDRMAAAGVTVCVGTDNGMLHDGDLLAELALLRAWFPHLHVEALLRKATWNGRALAGLPPALPPRMGRPLDVVVLPEQPFAALPSTRPTLAPVAAPRESMDGEVA